MRDTETGVALATTFRPAISMKCYSLSLSCFLRLIANHALVADAGVRANRSSLTTALRTTFVLRPYQTPPGSHRTYIVLYISLRAFNR